MSSLNKVMVIGNLGQDPEVRYMPNNDCVCNISIATSERWKDKNSGEQKEKTEWHRVVLWRRLGEVAGQYLRKGSKVYIEGKLETRKWQDNNGNDRYTTEINASEMKMLDSAGQGQNNQQPQQQGGNHQNRNSQGRQAPPQQQQPQQQQYQQPPPQQQQYQQTPPPQQNQQYQQPQQQQQYQQPPQQQGQGYPDDIPF